MQDRTERPSMVLDALVATQQSDCNKHTETSLLAQLGTLG